MDTKSSVFILKFGKVIFYTFNFISLQIIEQFEKKYYWLNEKYLLIKLPSWAISTLASPEHGTVIGLYNRKYNKLYKFHISIGNAYFRDLGVDTQARIYKNCHQG